MPNQVLQQRQRRGDSRNYCQVGGLHRIIKIIGHGIIHTLSYAYAYVEFIPWYAWLSLSSLF
jgi:hypothetical protein